MADAKRALSGARAQLLGPAGKEIGWATGVTYRENIQNDAVDVLGNIDTEEYVPVRRKYTISAEFVRILDQSLKTQGVWPRGGTKGVLDFGPISMQLFDCVTEKVLMKFEGVKPESQGWRVDANSVWRSDASFVATRALDEQDQ